MLLPQAYAQLTIDFDAGYSASDLAGQPGSGTQWALVNGGTNVINVASGVGDGGTQGLVSTSFGSGSDHVYYGFNTTNTDLGFTFDNSASILNYSFKWRATQALDGASGSDIFRFTIGSDEVTAGSAALDLSIRASGRLIGKNVAANVAQDGLFTQNVYSTISGVVDYSSNTYTVFVDGVQQWTSTNGGNLGFVNAASNNAYISIRNGSGTTAEWREWNMDTIAVSQVPEPSTYALITGVFVLGFACWRKRKV